MFINTPLGKIHIWTYHKFIEDLFQEERQFQGTDYDSVQRLSLEDLCKRCSQRESGHPKNLLNDILEVAFLNFFLEGEEIADVYLHHEGFFYRYTERGEEQFVNYTYDDFIKFHYLRDTFIFSDDYE